MKALDLARPDLLGVLGCHFVHVSWDQVLWAGLPALLLAAAAGRRFGVSRTMVVTVVAAIVTSLAVLVWERGRLESYCGASGLGHAFAGLVGVGMAGRLRSVFLGGLTAKVAFELATGGLLCDMGLERAGAVPVPVAHLAGLAVGMGLGVRFLYGSGRAHSGATSPGDSFQVLGRVAPA